MKAAKPAWAGPILATVLITAGLLGPAPLSGQQPLGQPVDSADAVMPSAAAVPSAADCPAADPADGRHVELRLGGMLIRAQVGEPVEQRADGASEGAGVQVRLVGCEEREAAVGAAAPDAAGDALLRLLHDLRIGVGLAATEGGECVEASFSIRDDSPASSPGARIQPDRPLAFQLCGLPIREFRPGS